MLKISTLSICLVLLVSSDALPQSCSVPQALTKDQMGLVLGSWTGYYELDGRKSTFSVDVKQADGSVHCHITNPPIAAGAQKESYRFCGSGAFHFKKEMLEGSYEFDAVPENGEMKGTLELHVGGKERFGEFYLKKK